MGRYRLPSALSAGVTRGIDRLARPRAHPRLLHVAGGILLGVSALFVELHLGALGHGTHLLYMLLIVMVASFGIGPAPGATALAVGAIGSAVASVAGLGPQDSLPKLFVQLVLYLLAGVSYLALLGGVIGARRRLVAQPPRLRRPLAADTLTVRELEILRLAAAGMTVDEMSALLVLSANTLKTHLSHIYQKLDAHNRPEAIRAALHCGCLTTGDICPHHLATEA